MYGIELIILSLLPTFVFSFALDQRYVTATVIRVGGYYKDSTSMLASWDSPVEYIP